MAAPKKPEKPAKKAFALRLDPAVHAAVERLAAAELRSANAQIEMLLREALKGRGIEAPRTQRPRRGRPPKAGS
ncbi:toxin-antitoxin system HicB family antitoxin [Erythrobacter sp. MTPC3]|uniref:toxin-antitoxin system HicB family antitoxin n=1 Tax=Erythrobacter sp. MTPC3 TaxID=3056564 RepID=UPI0036F2902A